MLRVLLITLLFHSIGSAATITVDRNTSFQTMTGWSNGKHTYAYSDAGGDTQDTTFKYIRDDLFDMFTDTLGFSRIRLEVRAGCEKPHDYWADYLAGTITDSAWKYTRYRSINDNDDPDSINWDGFNFSEMDFHVDRTIVPLRDRMAAKGEKLYVNLCYVSFGMNIIDPAESFHRTDAEEYAEFVLAAFLHLQNKYGFVPDSWEVILEPDVSGYGDGTLVGEYMVAAGDKLKAHGFTPDFIGPSNTNLDNAIKDFDKMIKVPRVLDYLTEFAYHSYAARTNANRQAIAARGAQYGVTTSMLEFWTYLNADIDLLYNDVVVGMNSTWQQKQHIGAPADRDDWGIITINFPDKDNYSLSVKHLVKYTRHVTQYVRPGAVRKGAATSDSTYLPMAFVNPDGKNVVVIRAKAAGSFTVDGLAPGIYGIRYTTGDGRNRPTAYYVDPGDQTIGTGGSITTSIPAAGVISITQSSGQVAVGYPGAIRFAMTSFTVAENGDSAALTVSRTGGSDGAVSVDYSVTAGTAVSGTDYTGTSGTLSWADGDSTAKTIVIQVIDDMDLEAGETVICSLKSVTGGARLAAPLVAVLTIADDEMTGPTTGLQGYWAFEGTGEDFTGNGYDGSWGGTPSYGPGHNGQAMDGAGGAYIMVDHAAGLDGLTAMTWSMWARKHTGATQNDVVYKHVTYKLRIQPDRFTGTLYLKGGTNVSFTAIDNGTNDTLWHHYALVWDGSTADAYIDGYRVSSTACAGTLVVQTSRDVYIGKYPWGNAFNGLLDEVRLYDDALDSIEVAQLAGYAVSLPVELTSFTATDGTTGVLLEWATASEDRNLGFNVLRGSSAGGTYATVNDAMIPGAGTTVQVQAYAFTDTTAGAGTWYYKLEQIDSSGVKTYSDPVAVTVTVSGIRPVPGQLNPAGFTGTVQWLDLRGNAVATVRCGVTPVLPAGMYLVRSVADGISAVRKVMLIK